MNRKNKNKGGKQDNHNPFHQNAETDQEQACQERQVPEAQCSQRQEIRQINEKMQEMRADSRPHKQVRLALLQAMLQRSSSQDRIQEI
jgi:hypothetical protein